MCLGRTHTLMGGVAGTVYATLAHLPPGQAAFTIGAMAGSALISDMDSSGSSAARTFGPVTRLLGWLVGKISGGHRVGTHWILGAPFIFAILASIITVNRHDKLTLFGHTQPVGLYAFLFLLALLFGSAMRALKIKAFPSGDDLFGLANVAVSFGLACLAYRFADVTTLPVVMTGGVLVHLGGDMLTDHGCPLLTPKGWRIALKWFDTGEWFETRVLTPLLAVPLFWIAADRVIPTYAWVAHIALLVVVAMGLLAAGVSWLQNRREEKRRARYRRARRGTA